jgi:tetraacyldisaccharide 4'-kinase
LFRGSRWIEQQLVKQWFAPTNAPHVKKKNLGLASWPESWIARRIENKRLQQIRLDRQQKPPVVVIGNLVVGGGGKTPLIVELSQQLTALGYEVAVICSGYGAKNQQTRRVLATDEAQIHGDEAVLLARLTQCPVFAGKHRMSAYQLAVERTRPDIVLSDDGLQHFALTRAMQFVCVDERGFGNQRMLPFGPLREPLSVLAQMDGLIVSEQSETLAREVLNQLPSHSVRCWISQTQATALRPMGNLAAAELALNDWLRLVETTQATIHLLAGIANPSQFFSMMRALFPQLKFVNHPLADHSEIDPALFRQIDGQFVVMTEKDAVKWEQQPQSAQAHWFALKIIKATDPGLVQFIRSQLF